MYQLVVVYVSSAGYPAMSTLSFPTQHLADMAATILDENDKVYVYKTYSNDMEI